LYVKELEQKARPALGTRGSVGKGGWNKTTEGTRGSVGKGGWNKTAEVITNQICKAWKYK
jgi:hypothetical protein